MVTEQEFFDETFSAFSNAVERAVSISENAMGVWHSGRQNHSLLVYAAMISHAMAIMAQVNAFKDSTEDTRNLNHFSIGSLGRSVIDAGLMSMYLSHPDLTDQEWELRKAIMNLHELVTRKRFFKAILKRGAGHEADIPFFTTYQSNLDKYRSQIGVLLKQTGVTDTVRIEKLQNGQQVYLDGARGAVREAGWDVNWFDFNQSYFSNWVHSHPVSFLRAEEQKISFSSPSDYQFNLCALIFTTCETIIQSVSDRIDGFDKRPT